MKESFQKNCKRCIELLMGSSGFLAHFVSGVWFFWMYAPEGMNPMVYSAIYNGGYLIVEFVVSAIIIFILDKRRLLDIYL